ncbi:MAG: hypothetical protein SFU98_00030 [Leptospiraceae bacterium]|nr:hypothetical protein [Leptospiraceae bacterium]
MTKFYKKGVSNDLVIHDRFYICKYDNGECKGIFGPSINALHKNDIIIVGNIEGEEVKRMEDWFSIE